MVLYGKKQVCTLRNEIYLEAKWGQQYPIVIRSWRNKRANLSVYFKYPEYVRKAIYTTNAIEAVHRQFRKLTKTYPRHEPTGRYC